MFWVLFVGGYLGLILGFGVVLDWFSLMIVGFVVG